MSSVGRSAPRNERPRLLVAAEESAADLCRLFAARGFVVVGQQPMAADVPSARPEIVVIDFQAPGAARVLDQVASLDRTPVLIGIAATAASLDDDRLDAAFVRPVDPARLFARAVILLGERRQRGAQRRARIPGVIAVVRGNSLFERVLDELHEAVSPVNAGAVLEQVITELGTTPADATEIDFEAAIVSGRLLHALLAFGEPSAIAEALGRAQILLEPG